MKITLLSQVPAYFEPYRYRQLFPPFQAQTLWLVALKDLGHQVQALRFTDTLILPQKTSAKIANLANKNFPFLYTKYRQVKNKYYYIQPENLFRTNKLLKLISDFNPQVVILTGGSAHFQPHLFKNLKSANITTLLLHGENPLESATDLELAMLPYIDLVVTNDPTHAKNWRKLGAKYAKALPYAGIDPRKHRRLKLKCRYDIVFIGSLTADRQEILAKIANSNRHLGIFGYLPGKLNPLLQLFYHGEAWGDEAVKIYNQAKIALNFVPSHMPLGGNMRTFEIPGCGPLQIASRCPANWYRPNKEIVLFDSPANLVQKINYYLSRPAVCSKIAKAAYKKTHRLYTYRQRFQDLLQLI